VIAEADLGPLGPRCAAASEPQRPGASSFAKPPDLTWQGAADDVHGPEVAFYWSFRNGVYVRGSPECRLHGFHRESRHTYTYVSPPWITTSTRRLRQHPRHHTPRRQRRPRQVGVRPTALLGRGRRTDRLRSGHLNFAFPLVKAVAAAGSGFSLGIELQLGELASGPRRHNGSSAMTWLRLRLEIAGRLHSTGLLRLAHYPPHVFHRRRRRRIPFDQNTNACGLVEGRHLRLPTTPARSASYFPDGTFWFSFASLGGPPRKTPVRLPDPVPGHRTAIKILLRYGAAWAALDRFQRPHRSRWKTARRRHSRPHLQFHHYNHRYQSRT